MTKRFLQPGGLFLATLLLDVSARLIERGYETTALTAILDWSVLLAGGFYLVGHLLEYVEDLPSAAAQTFRCLCSQFVAISVTMRRLIAVMRDSRLLETENCLCGSGKAFKNCCMRNKRDS